MALRNKIIRNPRTGQTIRFLQTSAETNGRLLEMETIYQPHSVEPPSHLHPLQDEDFTVLAGSVSVRLGREIKVLQAGQSLHIPKNQVHAMWNHSDAPATVNWKVRPALQTDYFLETAMGLAQDGKVDDHGIPLLLQRVVMAHTFADVFRLAKPSFAVQRILFAMLTPVAYLFGYRPTYPQYLD